jgi:hypothetical protein
LLPCRCEPACAARSGFIKALLEEEPKAALGRARDDRLKTAGCERASATLRQ